MNEKETQKTLAMIAAIWPSFNVGRDPRVTINVWGKLFENETYEQVSAAVQMFAETETKGFAPSPGALKGLIRQVAMKDELSEMEAWALVNKALRNGLYGYEEEYAKLPDEVKQVLGDAKILREWAAMDEQGVQTVVASNFMRSYRARREAARIALPISDKMKELLTAANVRPMPALEAADNNTER